MSSFINAYDQNGKIASPEDIAQSSIHEMFHTLRLDHPQEVTQTEDTKLERIGVNAFRSAPETDKNINNNVMSYSYISIDGRFGDNQTSLTPGQFSFLKNEIRIQNSDRLYKCTPDNYKKYVQYWNNWPGTKVK